MSESVSGEPMLDLPDWVQVDGEDVILRLSPTRLAFVSTAVGSLFGLTRVDGRASVGEREQWLSGLADLGEALDAAKAHRGLSR